MKTRIINFWESLRATYWFLPTLMAISAIVLALITVTLDGLVLAGQFEALAWLYTGGAEGARVLLSTVAGSMITVASLTFSITIVALTVASSQFGPRLLNNFMRDTGNQVVLGTFIATFLYCLLVLRAIHSVDNDVFVPQISIGVALLLTLTGLGVLIFFIHHVSVSINVENVIAHVNQDLTNAIERLFPEKKGYIVFEQSLREEGDIPPDFTAEARPVTATQSGYLQAIDYDGLMTIAIENDLLLRVEHRAGSFMAAGNNLALVWPGPSFDEELSKKIGNAFILGTQRVQTQDVEFAISQLVEIAVRALSPGINDPFTAMACVDRLGVALSHLAERRIPSGYRYDDENTLRLIANSITFAGITDTAFNQIRQHARSDVAVTIRLLETIAIIAARAHTNEDRAALLHHAQMIWRASQEALPEESDRNDVKERYQIATKTLEEGQQKN